ncbi:hypothetical protein [Methylomonas sp. MgM2]
MAAWLIFATSISSNSTVKADNANQYFLEQANSVTLEELDNERARGALAPIVLSKSTAIAILEGNSATSNVSGFNSIDNGSFAGASGMFSIIQNSGNNVIIQDSTVYNVTFIP